MIVVVVLVIIASKDINGSTKPVLLAVFSQIVCFFSL